MRVTWEDGDARRIVEEALAAGFATLVAGGGDGTLREVAEALARGRGEASLAILPLGTANDFARAAGIPLEPAAALALLDQTARPIDLGAVNGKLFLNMATGGFGSKVTANTSEDLIDPFFRSACRPGPFQRPGLPVGRRVPRPGHR